MKFIILSRTLKSLKTPLSIPKGCLIRNSLFSYGVEEIGTRTLTYSSNNYFHNERKNPKENKKFLNNSFIQIFYFGLGVSLSLGIYNYLKKKKNYISESLSYSSFFPSVNAAASFSYLNKDNINNSKPEIRKSCNFIADVVEKVSDGVVLIEIKDHRRRDYNGRTYSIANGSGFIIDKEGLILTSAHVVANKPRTSSIMVRLPDGKEYEGKIEELDVISDLALVRVNTSGLKPLNLGSSKDLRPGEFVVALGSPFSLSNTITSGVISSVGRPSKDLGLRGKDISYIQTDAAITFGNSGGPLVNLDGEVIGINSMRVTTGISFAIPVDHAKEFIKKAEKKRKYLEKNRGTQEDVSVKRRYLGITMLTLTPEIILQMQQRTPGSQIHQIPDSLTHGILVWRIVVGSPAYHAGLEPGDIVTHINGHEIHSSRDVYRILEGKTDLSMVVIRKGQKYSVTVAPEE